MMSVSIILAVQMKGILIAGLVVIPIATVSMTEVELSRPVRFCAAQYCVGGKKPPLHYEHCGHDCFYCQNTYYISVLLIFFACLIFCCLLFLTAVACAGTSTF